MRATVQVRIDHETRQQASELFERLGLDIPTAIRMFLKQSIEANGLPFQPRIAERDINGFSMYDAERIEKAQKQIAEGRGSRREMIDDSRIPIM
jgi:DNA-damage-inducible protein J